MDKSKSKVVVVSNETPISKASYYFTNGEVFKLKSYSRLVFYFMLFSVILLIGRALQGIDHFSLLIACGLVLSILLFLALWVNPKEKRMADMSFEQVKSETKIQKLDWSAISNFQINDTHVSFLEGNKEHWGKLETSRKEDVNFLKSRFEV